MKKKQTTILCPTCSQEHGLFYTVQKGGSKTLNYLCNKQVQYMHTLDGSPRHNPAWRYVTRKLSAPEFIDGLPIREEWSPGYRKEWEDAHNLQLIMTNKGHD